MEFLGSYKKKNGKLKKMVLIQKGAFVGFEKESIGGGMVRGSSGRKHLEVEACHEARILR